MIYALISISVFTIYLIFILVKFGVLKSISDSYYHLKNKVLFTLALWGFAFPAIIAGNTALMFLAGSGIVFVGVAFDFKENFTKIVHYTAAALGVVFGMVSLWLDFGFWFIPVGFILISCGLLSLKNKIFWIEVLAFYTIILTVLWKIYF